MTSGFVPGLLWLLFFYFRRKSNHGRRFRPILAVFALAAGLTVPAALIEHITGATIVQETVLRSALVSLFLIGPIEEFVKLAAVWMTVYHTSYFSRPLDGILYAATAAMSFASVENAVYVALFGPGVMLWRVIFATSAHVMFACVWGYALGLARFDKQREFSVISVGFVASAALHAIYNLLVVLSPSTGPIVLYPFMVFLAGLTAFTVWKAARRVPFERFADRALVECPTCGAFMDEDADRCDRCGGYLPPSDPYVPRYCGMCRAELQPLRDRCPGCGSRVRAVDRILPAGRCSRGAADSPEDSPWHDEASPSDPSCDRRG